MYDFSYKQRPPKGCAALLYDSSYKTAPPEWFRSDFVRFLVQNSAARVVPQRFCTISRTKQRLPKWFAAFLYDSSYKTASAEVVRSAFVRFLVQKSSRRRVVQHFCTIPRSKQHRPSGSAVLLYDSSYKTAPAEGVCCAFVRFLVQIANDCGSTLFLKIKSSIIYMNWFTRIGNVKMEQPDSRSSRYKYKGTFKTTLHKSGFEGSCFICLSRHPLCRR